jgi:hypothetical protein
MHLSVLTGRFAICRLAPNAPLPVPTPPTAAPLWSVTRTRDELSLVCSDTDVPTDCLAVERDWCALMVAGPLDFSLVGVLAALTAPLAEAEVSIFALSTFDTDYLLVKEATLTQAITALQDAGHALTKETI